MNTADVTGGKPIAVCLQSISGVSAVNALVAFYDIHGINREALSFLFYCNKKIKNNCFFSYIYKFTYHSRFIPERVEEISDILLRHPSFTKMLWAMRNTADVTDDNPTAVCSKLILGVVKPLDAYYDVHGGKEFLYSVLDTTQDFYYDYFPRC
jgi:hypothetical protein